MTNTIGYPSVDELIPYELKTRIPVALYDEIVYRYHTLGGKYLTEHKHDDGRRINGMMFTNRVENCIEEIVDAVFCILGWIFKHISEGSTPPDSAFTALEQLINLYSLLSMEKNDPLA